jgi:hypothetical protein
MATKTKTKTLLRAAMARPVATTPPWTTVERVERIEAMALRINGYVEFMCQAGTVNSTSNEALDKAIAAFYEQMFIMESRLEHIHNDFKLE